MKKRNRSSPISPANIKKRRKIDDDPVDEYDYSEDILISDEDDDESYIENSSQCSTLILRASLRKKPLVDLIEEKILQSGMDEALKERLIQRYRKSDLNDNKQREWFQNVLEIPFGKYIETNVKHPARFLERLMNILNTKVYGLSEVKEEFLNYAANCITNPSAQPRVLALCSPPGCGKCLGKDTLIWRADGCKIFVQDIREGDILLGDDNTSRTVSGVVKGYGMLFKIRHSDGFSYIVNSNHILTLRASRYIIKDNMYAVFNQDGVVFKKDITDDEAANADKSVVIDIELLKFLQLPQKLQDNFYACNAKSIKYWKKRETLKDPFTVGHDWAINADNYTKLSRKYIANSWDMRLDLLAGFLFGSTYISEGHYKLNISNIMVLNQIQMLSQSLGLEFHITGDEFKFHENRQHNVKFTVEPVGFGEYYGFELNGNGRFLLDNLTVTHNTSIVQGLAEGLQRPFSTFNLNGAKDIAHFVGFDFTYLGARYGSIVGQLMQHKVLNGVMFFDELDKLSGTHEGDEIENLLMCLTDPKANYNFRDKYFGDIQIDLSRAIIVFAFNDASRINPVLYDRLHVIKIQKPDISNQVQIAQNYLLPEIYRNLGHKSLVSKWELSNETIRYIIEKYCSEEDSSVRDVKRLLETIMLKLNCFELLKNSSKLKLSFDKNVRVSNKIVDTKIVDTLLDKKQKTNISHLSMYM